MTVRQLRLLGRFDLADVQPGKLGEAGQRLAALLAVRNGVLARWQAAQLLYADVADDQAGANLRAVIWRMRRCCPAVIEVSGSDIRLSAEITVDYWTAARAAQRLIAGAADGPDDAGGMSGLPGAGAGEGAGADAAGTAAVLTAALRADLREDLLPGWPDPWLIAERERFHQLRLHALEALCVKLARCGWHGAAVDAGLAVVAADPLRESAQRALIDAYLAEGNTCDAVRQYRAFGGLLRAELGLRPTASLRDRMAAVAGAMAAGRAEGASHATAPGPGSGPGSGSKSASRIPSRP